jgi:DNA-nicking Smr family endonuclease
LQDIALQVINKRLITSLNEFAKRLPFSVDEFNDMVVSLLMNQFEFDVSKVENALFNMVGLVERDPSEHLSHDKKQEFYNTARAPVLKLQEEYAKLKEDLFQINDTDSVEWRKKRNELNEMQRKLNGARRNAASDIFERMNSRGNMGALIEYIQEGVGEMGIEGVESTKTSIVHMDFHGLHVNEAKERIDEFVLPILPALKKMIVITGRGVHNETGSSVLKEELRKYFGQCNVKCEELKKNKGALCIQI